MARKKTRKQKTQTSQKRRQSVSTGVSSEKLAYQLNPELLKTSKASPNTKQVSLNQTASIKTNVDPKYILSDLNRTLILSLAIIGSLIGLYYLLTNQIIPNSIW